MDKEINELLDDSPLNLVESLRTVAENYSKPSINSPKEKKESSAIEFGAINPFEKSGYDKSIEILGGAPSTSSTPAELVTEAQPVSPTGGETVLNVKMEPIPVTVSSPTSTTIINQAPSSAAEPTITATAEPAPKSTVNETSIKKMRFSNLMEKIKESTIVNALGLPELKETVGDFAKVTKSQALGVLPDFKKVKGEANAINQIKESSTESIQAFKESTKTQNALEMMNNVTEMISNKEKEKIIESEPSVSTNMTKTETIEKSTPTVTPVTVSNTVTSTQNQGSTQTTNVESNQSTQGGSSSSQTVQNTNQSTQYQPAKMTTDLPQTQMANQPTILNTGEMEERLRRIEYALLNGIEVTIKQY